MLAGSVVTNKDGSEQVKFTQFYEALLEAKVQGNGNLPVGMAYTAMLERIAGANAWSGN